MSSRNIFFALVAVTGLSSCGFQPIAAPKSSLDTNSLLSFRDISMNVEDRRFHYFFMEEMRKYTTTSDAFDHSLKVKVSILREGLAIEQNDAVTRFNLTSNGKFSILNSEDESIYSDKVVSITALNATTSQFTTSISEKDAIKRLAQDTARRIVSLLRLQDSKD